MSYAQAQYVIDEVQSNSLRDQVSGIPPKVFNHGVSGGARKILIWFSPEDTVIEGQKICTVGGIKIRYKDTGFPIDPWDGLDGGDITGQELLNHNSQTRAYEIMGLTNGKLYYVKLFPYSDHNVFCYDNLYSHEAVPSEVPPDPPEPEGPGDITFTGQMELVTSNPTQYYAKLKTSGTLRFSKISEVDIFLVGGGAAGGNAIWNPDLPRSGSGYGGGGGYTKTYKKANSGYKDGNEYIVYPSVDIPVTVGSGGNASSIVIPTNSSGTNTITLTAPSGSGKNGGSGGGSEYVLAQLPAYSRPGQNGGSNGSSGSGQIDLGFPGGTGQGHTTQEFGETSSSGFKYGAGGGSGAILNYSDSIPGDGGVNGGGRGGSGYYQVHANGIDGAVNSGSGGGGGGVNNPNAGTGGAGGSGIVIIRWRETNT